MGRATTRFSTLPKIEDLYKCFETDEEGRGVDEFVPETARRCPSRSGV